MLFGDARCDRAVARHQVADAALDAVPCGSAAGAAAEVQQQCPACTFIYEGHPYSCWIFGNALRILGLMAVTVYLVPILRIKVGRPKMV